MSVLSAKQRNALPEKAFALPGRRYPVNDRAHAAAAMSRVAQYGTSAEMAKVHAAVHRRFPDMGTEGPKRAHARALKRK